MDERFFGIDLGTTNSAIANCELNDLGELNSAVDSIERKVMKGNRLRDKRDKILPSCVYYDDNEIGEYEAIVGDFAKEMYAVRPDQVAKSIKSQMGNSHIVYSPWDSNIPDKTPEQVSARILKHLITAQKNHKTIDNDAHIVITIPASFGDAQRKATIAAAIDAGINMKNADGSDNEDLLLEEPEAVMYNLINDLNNGKINIGISFDTPKNILIFDIGGGTLDVTIHNVERVAKSKLIKMRPLSISKYATIAGDKFDEALAKYIINKFIPEQERENKALLANATEVAEMFKIDINDDYKYSPSKDTSYRCNDIIVGNKTYEDLELTRGEFEESLSSLMANDLVYEDYKNIDSINETDNIIYPVLYAISEAKKRAEKEDVLFDKIDGVVLNGGMSKLYLIQERLQDFFGMKPITESDPDESVAKGAAIYNYYLHQENTMDLVTKIRRELEASSNNIDKSEEIIEETNEILPNNIIISENPILTHGLYIGYRGGHTQQIAEDGANLPLTNNTITGKVEKGQREIYIPILIQEGKNEKVQIAYGRININLNLKRDCYVNLNCSISKKQILSISATITSDWLGMNPLEATENIKISFGENKGNGKDCKLCPPVGATLNVNNEISSIVMACNNLHNAKKNTKKNKIVRQQDKYEKDLNKRTTNIKNAGNIEEFSDAIIKELSSPSCDEVLYNLLPVAHFMCSSWSDEDKASLLSVAYTILDSAKIRLDFEGGKIKDTQYSKIINFAIQIVGKIGDENAADKLKEFLEYFEFKSYVLTAFSTLGIEYETVYKEFLDYQYRDMFARGILWAVGNCFKKSNTYGYKVSDEKIVEKLISLIQSGELKLNELRCAETSMALICDRRPGTINQVSDALAEKALSVLETIDTYYESSIVVEQAQANIIAQKMIKGEVLGWDEETVLINNTDRLFDKSIGGETDE